MKHNMKMFTMFPRTSLIDHTYYINLAERPDRNAHALQEFNKIGIKSPTRINAIKHIHGAIGCTKSHIMALELAKERRLPYVFICEDDITFLNPSLLSRNIRTFEHTNMLQNWDVLIIGGNNSPPYLPMTDYCCRVLNCQAATGYIVKAHYYDQLLLNFKESVSELEKNPTMGRRFALDIYWKILQNRDRWLMITPPTVSQYVNYSNIEGRVLNYNHLMLDMEKTWLSAATGTAGALTSGPPLRGLSLPANPSVSAAPAQSGEPSVSTATAEKTQEDSTKISVRDLILNSARNSTK